MRNGTFHRVTRDNQLKSLFISDLIRFDKIVVWPGFLIPILLRLAAVRPASFHPGFPLGSMFSYSPAENPGCALRGRILAASHDERV